MVNTNESCERFDNYIWQIAVQEHMRLRYYLSQTDGRLALMLDLPWSMRSSFNFHRKTCKLINPTQVFCVIANVFIVASIYS